MRPRALLEHGAAFGRRQPVDDEPQRLAGGVRVDGADAMNHWSKSYSNSIWCLIVAVQSVSTPTTSCCRCRRDTSSRWRSTRGCASGSSPKASSRRRSCTRRRLASWDDLRLVHDAGVRRRGRRRHPAARHPAAHRLSVVAADGRALAASVGATIAAARAALDDGVAANLAGGTHHAFADRGEGFCVFNDVAVAARVLQRDHHARRIAVVDLDVHQGNGTAAIFTDDPSVFTFSMHGAKNFPVQEGNERPRRRARRRHRRRRVSGAAAAAPRRRAEPPSARLRLLSCRRRSVRRRSARPAQADHRRAATARRDRAARMRRAPACRSRSR